MFNTPKYEIIVCMRPRGQREAVGRNTGATTKKFSCRRTPQQLLEDEQIV